MNTERIECDLLDDPTNPRRHSVSGLNGVKYATEAPISGESISANNRNASRASQTSLRTHHRIGTWNVRGLLTPGKLSIVEEEMERLSVSILGISETHMRGNGHFKTATGNFMYFSGLDDSSLHGVGIIIPPKLNKFVLGYNPVSERILTMKLNTKPLKLNIIQVYAPTSTAKTSDVEVETLYNKLEEILDTIPSREMTMILGDWNAKVGSTKADEHLREVVGKYGLGTRNERGEKLIEFCQARRMTILNTCFEHHHRRLYTWLSPGSRYRNQIDYIILNSRWRSSVRNVKTFPSADCNSDHNMLIATFSLRLKTPKKRPKMCSLHLGPAEKDVLRKSLEEKLATAAIDQHVEADAHWTKFKTLVNDTLSEMKAVQPPAPKKSSWISDRTWDLTQQRRKLKMKGLQNPEVLLEYGALSKTIKACCREDKNRFINDICLDIENHSRKYQTADLFKKVRQLTNKFKARTCVIEDADGRLLHHLDEIAERWRSYCEDLYKDPSSNISHGDIVFNPGDREPDILRSEVMAAMSSLKNRKAPGPDAITAEVLKALEDEGINTLHAICNKVWASGVWPSDWTSSIILPLHKKGSTKQCDNYRTLALISHASKVLLHIINNRIRHFLDRQIPQEQAGFVKGKGTREQILNVRQLIEKAREYNVPVIMCFVDYSKAFDCVNWNSLWTVLSKLGVPEHLTSLIQTLYINSQGIVRINGTLSQPFCFKKGVRQGCILSPILFNAYGEYIMRLTCDNWTGGVRVAGTKMTNLRYADDTTLLAANEAEMSSLLSKMEVISNRLGLAINKSKTKIMVIDRAKTLSFTGIPGFQTVDEFIYLGSNISNTGSCENEIRRRTGMAKGAMSQLQKIWKNRGISLNTKIRLVRTLVFSIFLYGAETWTMKAIERARIDAFEMWCWRRMLRIPWTAFRTNVSILKQLRITTRLSTICLRRILEYFGHIARKDGDNLEKLIVTGKVDGNRSRGRSPTRWSDQIRTTLDTTVYNALHVAEDRHRWRNIIHEKLLEGGGHDPQK